MVSTSIFSQDIFDLLIKQLRHINKVEGDEITSERALYVLNSLATVRSCLILCELAGNEGPTAEAAVDRMVKLFDTLYDAMLPNTPHVVVEQVLSVITATIDELPTVYVPLLECVLSRLLLPRDGDGRLPRPNEVAAEAIRRCDEKLSTPISQFCKSMMRGEFAENDGGRFTKKADAHRLSLELPRASLTALDVLIPAIAEDLESEDDEARSLAVVALGKLFAQPPVAHSSKADSVYASSAPLTRKSLGELHAAVFEKWLKRFRDRNSGIRREMCLLGGEVLRAHEALAKPIADQLVNSMNEPVDEVRLAAVTAACDCASEKIQHVPKSLLNATAQRNKDKSMEVRREAITGLSQAYAARMPPIWAKFEEHALQYPVQMGSNEDGEDVPPQQGSIPQYELSPSEKDVFAKLSWVPEHVLECYQHPEPEMKVRVVQLLDHIMLPENLDESMRARGLVVLYASLNETARRQFHKIQVDRRRTQLDMAKFCSLREEIKIASKESTSAGAAASGKGKGELEMDDDSPATGAGYPTSSAASGLGPAASKARLEALKSQLTKVTSSLVEKTSNRAKGLAALHALQVQVPDNRVFVRLAALADPTVPWATMRSGREDLLQRIKMVAANAASAAGSSAAAAGAKKGSKATASAAEAVNTAAADMKAVADTVRVLVRRMAQTTVTLGMVPHLMSIEMEQIASGDLASAHSTLALLEDVAGLFPMLFAPQLARPAPIAIKGRTAALSSAKGAAAAGKRSGSKASTGDDGDGMDVGEDDDDGGSVSDSQSARSAASGSQRMSIGGMSAAPLPPGAVAAASAALARLVSLLHAGDDYISLSALGIVGLLGGDVMDTAPAHASMALRSSLLSLAMTGTPALAKHAVYAAVSCYSTGDTAYSFSSAGKAGDEGYDAVRALQSTAAAAAVNAAGAAAAGGRRASAAGIGGKAVSAGAPDEIFRTLISKLTSVRSLTTANPHLDACIASIGALALRAPAVYAMMDGVTIDPSITSSTSSKSPARGAGAASSSSSASASSPSAAVAPGKVTIWLINFVQSDVADDETPQQQASNARAGASSSSRPAAGAASATSGLSFEDADAENEEMEEDEDEVDGDGDEDIGEGFTRRRKGTGGKAGGSAKSKAAGAAKRKRDAAGGGGGDGGSGGAQQASKRQAGPGGTSVSSAAAAPQTGSGDASFKGIGVSLGIFCRILALKALGCVARGLALRAVAAGRAQPTAPVHVGGPAGGSNSTSSSSSAESSASAKATPAQTMSSHLINMAILRGDAVAALALKLLAAGGDLQHPRGWQWMPTLTTASAASAGADGGGRTSAGSRSSEVGTPSSTPARPTSVRPPSGSAGTAAGKRASSSSSSPIDGALSDADAAALRAAAGCVCIRLAEKLDSRVLPVHRYSELSNILQDSDALVRYAVHVVVLKMLKKSALPLRYLCWPMLTAIDSDKAVRKLGKTELPAAALVYARQAGRYRAAGQAAAAAQLQPEFAFPYALFLLSRDERRFPEDAEARQFIKSASTSSSRVIDSADKAGPMFDQAACLMLLLDAVLSAAHASHGNTSADGQFEGAAYAARAEPGCLSILYTMYQRLRDVEDASRPGDRSFQHCNDLCFLVLKPRMKDQAAYDSYPGSIPIPGGFFAKKNSSSTSASSSAGIGRIASGTSEPPKQSGTYKAGISSVPSSAARTFASASTAGASKR